MGLKEKEYFLLILNKYLLLNKDIILKVIFYIILEKIDKLIVVLFYIYVKNKLFVLGIIFERLYILLL